MGCGTFLMEVPHGRGSIPTKPRSRSVPDVAVLNSPFRFLRNCSLSADVFQGVSFGIGLPSPTLVCRIGEVRKFVWYLFYSKQLNESVLFVCLKNWNL